MAFYADFPFLDFVRSGNLDISLSLLSFGTVLQLTFDSQDGPHWGWYRKLSLQTGYEKKIVILTSTISRERNNTV